MKTVESTKTITERSFVLTEEEALAIRLMLGAIPHNTIEAELKDARKYQESMIGPIVCRRSSEEYAQTLGDIYDYLSGEFKR